VKDGSDDDGGLDEVTSIHAFPTALRQRLIDEGVLHPDGVSLRFAKPYVFASPSTAAGVVVVGTQTGASSGTTQRGGP
jgi:hypothetical protein